MISILVAYDENRLIGNQGKLPWHIKEELQFFKRMTEGHPLVMGRKTWDSLPVKPLPRRPNYVVTRGFPYEDAYHELDGPFFINDIASVKELKEPFIIGGAQVYELALKLGIVDRVIVSRIKGRYDGDAYFPILIEDRWDCNILEEFGLFDVLEFNKKR
jgi:dihydrofolate reductase